MLRATLFRRRPGFTLVELLVVIALFVLLLAMGAAVFPSLANSQKVVRSADRLSGWLLIAKARAKRDGAPRGLRVYLTQPDPANPARFEATECQYVEAPLPWNPNPTRNPAGGRVVFVQLVHRDNTTTPPTDTVPHDGYRLCYFVGTNDDLAEFDQRVRPGDHLYLPEYGSSHRILNIQGTGNMNGSGTPPLVGLPSPANQVTARALRLETYPHLGAAHSSNPPAGPPQPLSQTPPATGPNPSLTSPTGPNTYIQALTPSPTGTLVTYAYGFQSAPRTLMGEPILMLGTDTVIDWRMPLPPATLNAAVEPPTAGYRDWSTPNSGAVNAPPYHPSTTLGVPPFPLAQGYFEILFSPGGQVMNNPHGLVCLWLRDKESLAQAGNHPRQESPSVIDTLNLYNLAGEQVLVVVNTRSGLISTQPVAEPPTAPTPNWSPYQFAMDGLNTGL